MHVQFSSCKQGHLSSHTGELGQAKESKLWRIATENINCFAMQEYLYGKSTSCLTYNSFINKELILFSNMDNERSIPSLVDGKSSMTGS